MKWTGSVASTVASSYTCQLLFVGPSEEHSLLKKIQHIGQAFAFNTRSYNNKMTNTCMKLFSIPRILGISSVMHSN
jgi:hypothetical protein